MLRWEITAASRRPGSRLIVPGYSIGGIRLGESRQEVEKVFGRGRSTRRGFVSYVGGHVLVSYWWHDAPTRYVAWLQTSWGGFHTRSGIHVGSTRRELRPLYVTCGGKSGCYLLEGPWPDALATTFTLRAGKVVGIGMGNA